MIRTRRRMLLACLAACLLLGGLLPGPLRGGEARVWHAVVVLVNGQALTQDEIDEAALFIAKRKYRVQSASELQLSPEELEQLYTLARNELIKITLIHQTAAARGLEAPWRDVQRGLVATGHANPLLAPSMDRRFIEAEVLFDRVLLAEGMPPYRPSPREVLAFWTKYRDTLFVSQRAVRVRHIYLDTYGEDPWEVRAEAEALRREVTSAPAEIRGQVFAELATEHSEGRFARQAGLLRIGSDPEGWFVQDFPNQKPDGTTVFPEPMYLGIRALLREGEVSPVIRSDLGYHLLFLESVRGGEQATFREAQEDVRRLLEGRERERRKREWLDRAVRESDITWHDGTAYPVEQLEPPARDEPVL